MNPLSRKNKTFRSFFLALMICVLAGCSTGPTVMYYTPDGGGVREIFWPPTPETPRYRLAGVLQGEQNFGRSEQSQPSTGERVFRWLVGLGAKLRKPRELVRPQTGMVDDKGRIYVTDVGRPAVFVFDEPLGKLYIWNQTDDFGEFESPIGIAPGSSGEILVADSALARIVRLDTDGNPLGSFGRELLQRPTGLARNPATGEIYVADTAEHDIKVFTGDGRFIRKLGRRGTAPGEFNAPTHLAFANGNLYVTDTLNNRVQVLSADGQPVHSIGQRGLYVGNFTRPKGVTADTKGNVYVVESYYDHLLIFDAAGQFLLPIGGTGSAIGEFYLPAGTWTDARGRVYVADMFNGRVVIFQSLGI